jgi:hypothetical protein
VSRARRCAAWHTTPAAREARDGASRRVRDLRKCKITRKNRHFLDARKNSTARAALARRAPAIHAATHSRSKICEKKF